MYYRSGHGAIEIPAELAGTPEYDMVAFLPSSGLQWIDVETFTQSRATEEETAEALQAFKKWCADCNIRCSM